MNSPLLVPPPKELGLHGGHFHVPAEGYVVVQGDASGQLLISAEKLRQSLPAGWSVTASPRAVGRQGSIQLGLDSSLGSHGPEAYSLEIGADGAVVSGATPAAVYHGACKLSQIIASDPSALPTLSIRDWPDLPVRGVSLDISRCKVPTMESLYSLVDMLSEWGINHLELYTEHTFAYVGHENVWRDASPMTGGEILALDRHCAERFVELTPCVNSFSHMERWLKHPEYLHLAECPDGCVFPDGVGREPFALSAVVPGSIDLLSDLYSQLLPHFSSRLFNVGCDETFDLGYGRSKYECEKLGKGRVYLDYLLKVYDLVTSHGRTMAFWGDIMLNHGEFIPELPRDVIALAWGYEADDNFEWRGQSFAATGVPFWMCPGTSTWLTIAGRTNNCIGNLRGAAVNGLKTGATGYLNTDWGDGGHIQYLPASYLGFLYGASMSWNAGVDIADRLPEALNALAFRDSAGVMGRVAYDLGNVYEKIGKKIPNRSPIWEQLTAPLSNLSVVEGISESEFAAARELAEQLLGLVDRATMNRPDGNLVQDEYRNAARMTMLACDLGTLRLRTASGSTAKDLESRCRKWLDEIADEHKRLWLARNRPGGMDESLRYLRATH